MTAVTLSRYFFRRQLSTIIQFTLGMVLVILVVDFTELSGRLPENSTFTALDVISLSLLRIPSIVQTTFPFTVLFSSMATLIGLNRKYELVVARSAGISAWQFLAPLVLASFLVGVFSTVVLNPIAARALHLSELREVDAGLRNRGDADGQRPPWIRQQTEDGTTIIGATSVADNGLTLAGVTFLRVDKDGELTERYDAARAQLLDGRWYLTDIRVFRPNQPEKKVAELDVKTTLKPEFVQESLARPEAIPFFDLPRKIEAARSFGLSANGFAMQYHALIAIPMLLAVMTVIAATVSLKFVRFGQSISVIVGGVLAGFVLYVSSVIIKAFGQAGTIPPMVAAWLPVVVAGAIGMTILLHREDG